MDAESREVVQTVGPLHPDTRDAELRNLAKGSYAVQLEIHVSLAKNREFIVSDFDKKRLVFEDINWINYLSYFSDDKTHRNI